MPSRRFRNSQQKHTQAVRQRQLNRRAGQVPLWNKCWLSLWPKDDGEHGSSRKTLLTKNELRNGICNKTALRMSIKWWSPVFPWYWKRALVSLRCGWGRTRGPRRAADLAGAPGVSPTPALPALPRRSAAPARASLPLVQPCHRRLSQGEELGVDDRKHGLATTVAVPQGAVQQLQETSG